MDTQTLWLVIRSAVSLVALGTIVAFMMQRNIKQYRESKRINIARLLMALSFFFSLISHVIYIGYYALEIQLFEAYVSTSISEFSLNTTLMATTIMFSATFAAYINGWDTFVLFPAFLLIGAIVMSIVIPEISFVTMFIMTFGIVSMLALFQAGIKLKDNMALGIGIMSLLQLIASFGGFYFQTALSMSSTVFAAITISGLFRPFGKQGA